MTSLVVKTRLPTSDDVRRFCIKSDSTSFASLLRLLKELYPKIPNLNVIYQASDHEHVNVKSEEDFRAVVLHALKSIPPILRLTITPREIAIEEPELDASWVIVPESQNESERPQEKVVVAPVPVSIPVPVPTAVTKPPTSQPIAIVRKNDDPTGPMMGTSASPSSSGFSFGSIPSIFGFQLPTLSSSKSSGSLAEQIKEANNQINLLEKQAKEGRAQAQVQPQPQSTKPVEIVRITAQPEPPKNLRTAEVTARSSVETLALCSQMSELTKSICSFESSNISNILQQAKNVEKPASCTSNSSMNESQRIASDCFKASEDTSKMVHQNSTDAISRGSKSESTGKVLQNAKTSPRAPPKTVATSLATS